MTVNTTLIWTLKDNVSASANRINNNLDKVGLRAKGATGLIGKLGVATGGLVTPTSLAAAGTLAFAGVLVDSARAAIEEEKNIAKLGASLKANIPYWSGNTDAIEKTISARENLAFADDELRDSLALLVGATHDVSKAFTIQQTAMDLARFKGISLQEASEALIKVEAGQYRALKALGIQLPKNATAQEALTAVQKVAEGQAASYASTIDGKLTVAQIRFNDAQEDLGKNILPIVTFGMERLADIASGDILGTAEADAERFAKVMAKVHGEVDKVEVSVDTLRVQATEDMRAIAVSNDDTAQSFSDLANASGDAANDMMEQWTKAADDLIGKAYDPLIEHEQLLADQVEISTLEQIASKRKLTAEERLRLDELHKSEAEHLLALAEAGQTSSGAFEQGIADLKEQIDKATGPTKTYLQGVLDQLLLIKANSTIRLSFPTNVGNIGYIGGARASGGPVSSGGAYIVGEEGPEMFVPSSSGNIVPNDQLSRVSGGGVSEVHTHIYLDGRQIAESVDRHSFNKLQRAPVTAGRV